MNKVKLADVAIESRESLKIKDSSLPVVGLEHIIPEQINLTEWDVGVDNTFTKIFKKNDVLFGRRRAYLKKAAVAPCEGICSGDITVIRAKEDKILPELLPFVIQNDIFFDYAVGKSAGSLSPRVKWEHLANYEFNLPSLSEQKKLAETLWSIVATMESYKKLLAKTDEMVKAKFVEMFGDNNISTVKLSNECELITKGTTPTTLGFEYLNEGINFIKIENIDETGHFLMDNIMHIGTDCNIKMKRSELKKDDILFSIAGAIGRTAIVNENILPANINQTLSIIRLKENSVLSNRFLRAALVSDFIREQYMKKQRGIAQINLSLEDVSNLIVPIPSFELQKEYVNFVQKSEESKSAIQASLDSLTRVYKKIIAENLGGNE